MQFVIALIESQCKYFLYENNKSMSGKIKTMISRFLGVEPIMINSSKLSAQNRERYYWTNIPNVTQPDEQHISLIDILTDSDFKPYRGGQLIRKKDNLKEKVDRMYMLGATNEQSSIGCRVYDLHGKAKTLCANAGGGGAKTGLYMVGDEIKSLSVSGAEKLQTLPVGYTNAVKPEVGISLCGNGWTVDVITHILKNLGGELNENNSVRQNTQAP